NTSGLTFRNHTGSEALINTDDIDGMFEVAGAQITIDGIELLCSTCSPATANTTGLSNFPEDGALVLPDGAVALLANAKIAGSQTSGVFLTRNSAISIVSATIAGNVQAGSSAGPLASGIFAGQGSSVRLGNPDGTGAVTVAGNGFVNGAC